MLSYSQKLFHAYIAASRHKVIEATLVNKKTEFTFRLNIPVIKNVFIMFNSLFLFNS